MAKLAQLKPLDDATIEQGDEHTTDGPQASMMSFEQPEAIISLATS